MYLRVLEEERPGNRNCRIVSCDKSTFWGKTRLSFEDKSVGGTASF